MSPNLIRNLLRLALVPVLTLPLCACSYDYAQRTDRVAYGAGNAVKSNIALHTTDPSKKSMNKVSGLGKDGDVISDGDEMSVLLGPPVP